MQSYIVRIYRRERGTLMGVVEDAKAQERYPFRDREELWNILNSNKGAKKKLTTASTGMDE